MEKLEKQIKEYERIYNLLPQGEKNAWQLDEAVYYLGFPGKRQLQVTIHLMRKGGYLILSSNNGIFRPSTDADVADQEIRHFFAIMTNRALHTLEAARGASIYLSEVKGQMTLDDVEGWSV